jgi:hypothetical protein
LGGEESTFEIKPSAHWFIKVLKIEIPKKLQVISKDSMLKMNAWLLTWEVLPTAERDIDKIAAILSYRKPDNKIAEIVELLYLRSMCSAFDMAYYANRRKEMLFKVQQRDGYIICDSNPYWLYARRVTNLQIQVDKEKGKEILSWIEPPTFKFKDYEIDEIIEGESRYWERKYFSPLSKDTW